jgi:hypothetical protein
MARLLMLGGGVEFEVSRLAHTGPASSTAPALRSRRRTDTSRRSCDSTGLAQFVGIEIQPEVTDFGRR